MRRTTQTRGLKARADRLFSGLIRQLGYCQSCGSTTHLQCAHIHSRRYVRVRWDRLNAVCLCAGCHLYYTDNPVEFAAWVATVRTPDQLEELRRRRDHGPRPDLDAIVEQLRRAVRA